MPNNRKFVGVMEENLKYSELGYALQLFELKL